MTNLFAFDCDGTLEVSNGVVKISDLKDLESKGYIIVIVSPSPFCMSLPFHHIISGITRKDNLLKVKEMFPAERYYYVSDNPGDDIVASESGYTYIHPNNFNPNQLAL